MSLPNFTMKDLIKAGVHFGHNTRRWNPKMKPFIYGTRDKVHIIDLQKTVPLMYRALQEVKEISSAGGKILFVGTKRQAQEAVKEASQRCGQYYVNHRWLGGMITNWQTVSKSIRRLKELKAMEASGDFTGLTKKEISGVVNERIKLEQVLGGIEDMGRAPDLIFIIDPGKEALAVQEANKLGVPVVAICDTNCNPDGIDYIIPGNDDASRAIELYCDLISKSVIAGIQDEMTAAGVDLGEFLEVADDEYLDEAEEEVAATEK